MVQCFFFTWMFSLKKKPHYIRTPQKFCEMNREWSEKGGNNSVYVITTLSRVLLFDKANIGIYLFSVICAYTCTCSRISHENIALCSFSEPPTWTSLCQVKRLLSLARQGYTICGRQIRLPIFRCPPSKVWLHAMIFDLHSACRNNNGIAKIGVCYKLCFHLFSQSTNTQGHDKTHRN